MRKERLTNFQQWGNILQEQALYFTTYLTCVVGTFTLINVFGNGSGLSRLHQRVLPLNFSLKVQIAQPQTHGAPIEHTMQTIMLHRDRDFCVLDCLQSWLQSQSPTALQQRTPEKIECLSIDEASA